MSIAKITTVKRSMKPNTCGKCGIDLPKGSAYLWWSPGFRSRVKKVRCLNRDCYPKDSERESSLLADVYAAREHAEDRIYNCDDAEEMQEIVNDYAEAIREVAGQYEEAMTDDNGNVWNTMAEERYEALESAADEVESAADSIEDQTSECEKCAGSGEIECETCEGSGLPEGNEDVPEGAKCADCDGTGKIDCEDCDGSGEVPDVDAMREAAQEALDTDLGC